MMVEAAKPPPANNAHIVKPWASSRLGMRLTLAEMAATSPAACSAILHGLVIHWRKTNNSEAQTPPFPDQ